jgi:acyl-CoA thioester hydrolase
VAGLAQTVNSARRAGQRGNGRMHGMTRPEHSRATPLPRQHFAHFQTLTTRWMDNDIYGHMNNVVHYALFDTAVNAYLIQAKALDIHNGDVIGLVVKTQCDYFDSLAYPQAVQAGLRVTKMGESSVHYEVGLFADGAELAAAVGQFVHVYVDRHYRRPVPLPDNLRAALVALQTAP